MIFAASMGEPPPSATITSGLNFFISSAPARAQASVGSGVTSKNSICVTFIASSIFVTSFTMPLL